MTGERVDAGGAPPVERPGTPSLLTRPASHGARRVALGHLRVAVAKQQRLETGDDPEALHDFRVAVRRLRTTLRAFRAVIGPAAKRKRLAALRRFTRDTGGGRDAEVQLAWLESALERLPAGARAFAGTLAERLEAEKAEGYARALGSIDDGYRALARKQERRLLRLRLPPDGAPPAERDFAAAVDRILLAWGAELETSLAAVRTAEDAREAHRARIRGKRVRYVLEGVADEAEAEILVDRLKGLQDALGDLRDLQLLAARVRAEAGLEPGADAGPDAGPEAGGETGHGPLLELLGRDIDERFETFRAGWMGEGAASFFAALGALRRDLRAASADGLEIERKYLLSGRPGGLERAESLEFEQGYLPGERLQERLRWIGGPDGERRVRSLKLGTGLVRTEVEEEIDAELFDRLWPLTEGRRLTKRRHRVADGELVWEIDEFTDRELWLAEVELLSADLVPEPPAWLAPHIAREVTGEPGYLNVNLAM